MKRFFFAAGLLLAAGLLHAEEKGDILTTPWTEAVTDDNAHREYPRPQMVRREWLSLNGLWDYATLPEGETEARFDGGRIRVPFPAGSPLSGVDRVPAPDETLCYRRDFTVPAGWKGHRVLLHFGAVDWAAEVWLNGKYAGRHTGGYAPWSLDVTPFLRKKGSQQLVVKVTDPTDSDACVPHGKQAHNTSGGIWYTPVTGIWQSVWLEPVAQTRVERYYSEVDLDASEITLFVETEGLSAKDRVTVELLEGAVGYDPEHPSATVLATAEAEAGRAVLRHPGLHPWSPEDPYLYGVRIRIRRGGKTLDTVEGYLGARTVSTAVSSEGLRLFALNGRPLFHLGTLDQGWWPDGLYTPPSDEAIAYDIQIQKELGFNMIRKHIKVESARWFYHCDRLGMLVWQDMPSIAAGGGTWNPSWFDIGVEGDYPEPVRDNFYKELGEMIDWVRCFNCVVMWIPFNEGWGQFETEKVTAFIRSKDATRPVDAASGGSYFRGVGDVLDCHNYPNPMMRLWDRNQICVLGEFGGIGFPVEGHLFRTSKRHWGYVQTIGTDAITTRYEDYAGGLEELVCRGLAGAVYTQVTDVESEVNGLLTYDRKVLKFDRERVAAANRKVIMTFFNRYAPEQ